MNKRYLFLMVILAASALVRPIAAAEKNKTPALVGQRYEARVPATLDLAERARLAINGLTRTLDEEHNYEMFFLARFTADPPYLMHMCIGDLGCTPKYAESLPMMRLMSGSEQNRDVEMKMMKALTDLIGEDGLWYTPAVDRKKTPWRVRGDYPVTTEDMASVFGNARMMLAMQGWYQRDRDPAWLGRLAGIARGLDRIAIKKDDYAFYPEGKVGMEFSYLKKSGWKYAEEPKGEREGAEGTVTGYQGGQIRALSRLYQMTGDKQALDLAGKLVTFITKPKFWTPDEETPWINSGEHGFFAGHFHGHLIALRGILEYAKVTNDPRLKEFVRDAYEHARCWGIGRLGIFGCGVWGSYNEGCNTADMIALATKLSDYGVGDYWEDVDQYVRNNLAEQQLTRADLLEKVAKGAAANPDAYKLYPQKPMGCPWNPTMWQYFLDQQKPAPLVTDRVAERCVGLFGGFSHPTSLPYTEVCGCCSGNGTQAIYYAWEGIVRGKNDVATVNLLLNRASPWLDLDSYLPYEGKVVIMNKTAKKLRVRVPRWADKKQVEAVVNKKEVALLWLGNYLLFDTVDPGDTVTITFPMVQQTIKLSYPFDKTYTCTFKGNTLVDIAPRDTNPAGYPTYLRDDYKNGTRAPMVKVTRYLAPYAIEW